MRFLVQGLIAVAILLYISVWVAAIPTTSASAKADAPPAGLLDAFFNLQADQ